MEPKPQAKSRKAPVSMDSQPIATLPIAILPMAATPTLVQNKWYYPPEISHDLQNVNLSIELKEEIIATVWEYTRIVIPTYTNWPCYIAFIRCITIAIIAEFRGELLDITSPGPILGYDVNLLLSTIFAGTPGEPFMGRELRAMLLISCDKSSHQKTNELFRRYVNSLPQPPRKWFRIRDCDAMARFTIASALVCNDLNSTWFTDEQFEILTEICCSNYDAVAFYKHRAEGEMNCTFAYMPEDLRREAFHMYREVLWALDVAWRKKEGGSVVVNLLRFFGGPLHMLARRHRFVEEGLMIGMKETEVEVCDVDDGEKEEDIKRYRNVIARSAELLFPGLAEILEEDSEELCKECRYRDSYGAQRAYQFGGVEICDGCREKWRAYLKSFPVRAVWVFPELEL